MSETAEAPERAPETAKKSRILPLAAVAALALGGASFYAAFSGMVSVPFLTPEPAAEAAAEAPAPEPLEAARREETAAPEFVTLAPLVIPLASPPDDGVLRVSLIVETAPGSLAGVEASVPRIMDVLNTFLRAVDRSVLAEPAEMSRLRAQMLRRVSLVTPPGAVRDLLIQEFVLN